MTGIRRFLNCKGNAPWADVNPPVKTTIYISIHTTIKIPKEMLS